MAKVNWRGQSFVNDIHRRMANGLQEATKTLKVDYQRALRISNQDGDAPSGPGDIPRKGTGAGLKSIVNYVDRSSQPLTGYVAMMPPGRHLLMLDGGTRAHLIVARGGGMLMIRWRSKNAPSQSTIKLLGLKRIGKHWYYFRRIVKHPGTKPRPWVIPVFMLNSAKLGMILASRSIR